MIVFINQACGPLCKDMSLAFADSFDRVELYTGSISVPMKDLPPNLKIRHSIKYNRKNSVQRAFSWVIFTLQCFARLMFSKSRNRVWVLVSNPPLVPLLLGWLAELKGIPYILVVYDLYPDVLVQTKVVRSDSQLIKVWAGFNRKMFERATAIATLSEGMKASVNAYLKQSDSVQVIYNWADNTHIKPILPEQNNLITANNWLGKFIILYSGNLGATHDLESLLEAACLLKDERDILFVIAGEGSKKEGLMALAAKSNLINLEFIPYQSHENFPSLLAAADIAVIALGNGAEGLSVPSKTYTALASGACLLGISPDDSELSILIKKYQAGRNFIPGAASAIAEFILTSKYEPEALIAFKRNALHAARDFTPANTIQYTKMIINSLATPRQITSRE